MGGRVYCDNKSLTLFYIFCFLKEDPKEDLTHCSLWADESLQYVTAEWEPAFLRQAREFLFFPLLPREVSKRVPIFDRGTGSKPERLRSSSLQADSGLSLIV